MFLRVMLRSLWCWGVLCAGVLCAGVLCAGVLAENNSADSFSVRLVGPSRCEGEVEFQRPGLDWTTVDPSSVTLGFGARLCSALDCGTVLSVERKTGPERKVLTVSNNCEETSVSRCFKTETSSSRRVWSSSVQSRCGWSRGPVCVQDQCRSGTGPGPGSVTGTWTSGGQRCCAGSWTVGLLLSSRGRSLLWGRRSTVRAMSLL
ncbi:uncharacterized protein LOC129408314 isoform X2 [Boleophthalmus pectinirostris]|uniref:uncharacterized protein LOC129408314 isoform X2 n=1 Tax=Boleophthalmus pectinirostris TaxID=150288 RepID=UPI00242FB769|nr:uncharacterized protein LOC129408314 isoform X2 [Boleophthalmus pectinirostris]